MSWLIAALGNPGREYEFTRHNAGAMVADELAGRTGERFRAVRFVRAEMAEIRAGDERVLLVKSHAYMNDSGPSYASVARKRDVPPEHVIAVHDEIDLPFGALRAKFGGSTAGHNGLKSLQRALRTPEFHRVRIGVGRPPGRGDPAEYVLRPFSKAERADVPLLIDDAAAAALTIVREGLEAAQDRYNRSAPTD
jgi:peptidyl-tRNA hydrolase, PTH1 family